MEVLKQSRDFDKKELYQVAHNDHIKLKDVPSDSIIHLTDFISYVDDKGTEVMILYHTTDDGENVTVSTTSPTVMKSVIEAYNYFETARLDFILRRSQSKAGRTFMNVEVV